jgi:hypothetical protein
LVAVVEIVRDGRRQPRNHRGRGHEHRWRTHHHHADQWPDQLHRAERHQIRVDNAPLFAPRLDSCHGDVAVRRERHRCTDLLDCGRVLGGDERRPEAFRAEAPPVPEGMTCHAHEFEAREGGSIGSRSRTTRRQGPAKRPRTPTPTTGRFVKLVPNEPVVEVDEFETTRIRRDDR